MEQAGGKTEYLWGKLKKKIVAKTQRFIAFKKLFY
jgi:hypothetical protein